MRNSILSLVVPLSLCDNYVSRSYHTIRRKHRVKGLCRRLGLAVLYQCFLHSFPCIWKALSPVLLAMRCVMQWTLNQHQLPELLTMLQLVYWTFRPLFNSKCIILSLMSWFFMKFPLFFVYFEMLFHKYLVASHCVLSWLYISGYCSISSWTVQNWGRRKLKNPNSSRLCL